MQRYGAAFDEPDHAVSVWFVEPLEAGGATEYLCPLNSNEADNPGADGRRFVGRPRAREQQLLARHLGNMRDRYEALQECAVFAGIVRPSHMRTPRFDSLASIRWGEHT